MIKRTPYRAYGSGIYRREINVKTWPGIAIGEIVDDFHHFRTEIHHDGKVVKEVIAEVVRAPWSTCPETINTIKVLKGMPLKPSLRSAGQYTPIKNQCTHMFDAAALTIARLARGLGDVVYTISIADRDHKNRTSAEVKRDGKELITFKLDNNKIISPPQFLGQKVTGGGLADWAEVTLDADILEATLLCQRACLISQGRAINLESFTCAEEVPSGPIGACYTFTNGTIERAVRIVGSVRDLTYENGPLRDAS